MQLFHKLIIPRYLEISRLFNLVNICVGERWRDGNPKAHSNPDWGMLSLPLESDQYDIKGSQITHAPSRSLSLSHPLFKPKGTDYTRRQLRQHCVMAMGIVSSVECPIFSIWFNFIASYSDDFVKIFEHFSEPIYQSRSRHKKPCERFDSPGPSRLARCYGASG